MGQIPYELAESDFMRFAATARIRLDNPRNKKDIEEDKAEFIYEVMEGRITVDEDGYPTVHTECESLPEVKFTRRPKATALRASDRAGKGEMTKMLAMIADTIGVPSAKLNALDMVDLQTVQFVFGMFLG